MKTNEVPSQCHRVKGFWKYKMEKMRLTNLRRVTTSVTVREAHSVVRMNTPRMHTYLRSGVKGAFCELCLRGQQRNLLAWILIF
jgi:hypothetical protein